MRFSLFALLGFCVACSASDDGPPIGGGGGAGGGGASTSPAAPKILSLSTNTKTVRETDVLTVTAVVTDPDGIGDVIGGQLMTSDGNSAYGAFATDAGEGAYSLTLTWNAINATESIDTMVGSPAPRVFRATFFDAAGNSTYRDLTIALQCRDAGRSACDGVCNDSTSYNTVQECGSCTHSCPTSGNAQIACIQQSGSFCVASKIVTQRVACATQCAAPYPRCAGGNAAYQSQFGVEYIQVACAATAAAMYNGGTFMDLECVCAE